MKVSVTLGETNGDPSALCGVIDMIVESIKKDESIGGTPERKMKELQWETHVLSAICNTLMKDEKHNPFKNYAKRLAGNESTIHYSSKALSIAMSLWLQSPAAYEVLQKSGWIISLPST